MPHNDIVSPEEVTRIREGANIERFGIVTSGIERLCDSHELLRQQNQRLVRERDEQNKKLDELRSRCRLGLKILEALV